MIFLRRFKRFIGKGAWGSSLYINRNKYGNGKSRAAYCIIITNNTDQMYFYCCIYRFNNITEYIDIDFNRKHYVNYTAICHLRLYQNVNINSSNIAEQSKYSARISSESKVNGLINTKRLNDNTHKEFHKLMSSIIARIHDMTKGLFTM